ncbi:polyubiquitin-tagged protein recognition complex, Npl4 component [Macrolepiota fuliginosa MF-IS2]|uniref:Nuclear protein localization protein 4 n=1 Tax=Macrolepiota fuliginosa MF-IS2 TaxID=1400762 RepID=A0A9P6C5K5_9AGAR|nr:polyubiquitin-tagged protein recognition complex, Npl4 component [Macrolepiota fuliginosa MF-IS2]
MIIRIRSKDGNFRFDLQPSDDVSVLLDKVLSTAADVDPSSITISNQPRGNEIKIEVLKGRTLQNLGLNHGDLIFVSYQSKATSSSSLNAPTITAGVVNGPSTIDPAKRPWELVKEDPVDEYWRTQDGKIPRGKDAQFCKHGPKGMCDYCMPLEPYDAAYHKENNIKYLSYHAYLRKVTPKQTLSASSILPPLNPLSYQVKVPCPTGSHPSWPAGICTGCQPSTITLQSQPFRMVDHLEIASMEVIDRFLQAWRMTGLQRFGWLIGRYEPYDKVPMGVKAVVEAIYEPPQQGELDGLTLGWPWEDESRVRELSAAASVSLTVVGYIFTDLTPTLEDRTKNIYKRHPQSFFLSSLEAIFAGKLQKDNPTSSKSSPTGQYGSRLVTAVLTATEDGQVDITAYQVSEQAVAMVDADMIEASVEPGIVRVKEEDRSENSARYIPDVFFSYKNEYGLEVKKSARPCFPVEYLLVNVTHGFPQNPSPLFSSAQFKIENRPGLEDQTLDSVMSQLLKLDAPNIHDSRTSKPGEAHKRIELAKWLSDWHLITFLGTTQLVSDEDLKLIMRTVTDPKLAEDITLLDPVLNSDSWQTLMTFTRESAPASSSAQTSFGGSNMDGDIPQEIFDQIAAESAASGGGSSAGISICPHCTFENSHGGHDCEVCGLPL